MKKQKLVVNKRAIRELGNKDLQRVAGGLPPNMHISQYCSGEYTATCTVQCSDYNTRQ